VCAAGHSTNGQTTRQEARRGQERSPCRRRVRGRGGVTPAGAQGHTQASAAGRLTDDGEGHGLEKAGEGERNNVFCRREAKGDECCPVVSPFKHI
jgi:hypothetical protein